MAGVTSSSLASPLLTSPLSSDAFSSTGSGLTNLLTWSEDFSNGAWVTNLVTVTADTTVAPDSTTTADTLAAGVGDGYVRQSPITIAASTQYTFSVYLKAAGAVTCGLYLHGNQSSTPESQSPVAVTTSWQRFSITGTTGAAESTVLVAIGGYNNFNNVTVFAWGAQLNMGAAATPYVKTTSSPIT